MTTDNKINRSEASKRVRFVVDDAMNGRRIGEDSGAIVREPGENGFRYGSRILCYSLSDEKSVFVAVHSYLDVELSRNECEELAADYLQEIGVLSDFHSGADEYCV